MLLKHTLCYAGSASIASLQHGILHFICLLSQIVVTIDLVDTYINKESLLLVCLIAKSRHKEATMSAYHAGVKTCNKWICENCHKESIQSIYAQINVFACFSLIAIEKKNVGRCFEKV